MWLRYGVNQDNNLVSIEDSPRGKTQLRCPYCGGELTAKKGSKKEHHFAHSGETCSQVVGGKVAKLSPAAMQRLKPLCRWNHNIATTGIIILPQPRL